MKKIYCFLMALTSLSIFFMASCQDSIEHSPYVDPNKQVANKIIDDSKELPKDVFISEYFSTDLGNFLPYTNNDQVNFEVDYNVAKVSGCIDGDDGKLYLKSDAWIIANTIDLSNQDSVYYSFDQIIAYESGNALKNQTLLISSDFTGDYTIATWDTLAYSVSPSTGKPASWDKFDNTKFYLDKKYLTSNVTFAFKYSSTEEHTSTWEIKNFIVKRGKITETKPYTFKEKQYLSNSSLEKPATVLDVIEALTSDTVQVFVTGFVVGYIDGSNMSNARIITDPAQCGSVSNILIADNANETNTANCIPINLVSGSQFRTVLNIKDNNDILGKQITLGGYVMSYMSTNGLRNLFYSQYGDKIINNGFGTLGFDGVNNVKSKVLTITDTLLNSQGSFSVYNSKNEDLQKLIHIWTITEKYGMKANALANNKAYESEGWFISPSIDLSKIKNPELIFQHALMNFNDITDYCSVLISTDYVDGNPADAKWTKLNVSNWPNSTSYVESKILLTDYKSANNVHIAFKYTSGNDDVKHAGVWEIKTISLNEKEAEETPISGFDGPDNTSKSVTYLNETFLNSIGAFSIYDVSRFAKKDQHIWVCDSKYGMTAQASKDTSESWLISPIIDASSYFADPTLEFSHTAKNFTNFSNDLKLMVSEDYVSGNDPTNSAYHWKQLEYSKTPSGTNFTYVKNSTVFNDLKGKQFYFAFVYKATSQNIPIWEIKNLSLVDLGKPTENEWDGNNNTANKVSTISTFNTTDFSIYDVKKFSTNAHIWKISNGMANGSSSSAQSESWLISPSIDLTSFNNPELSFFHNLSNYTEISKYCSILISSNFDNDNPTSATWKTLDAIVWPTSSTYKENVIKLDDYKSFNNIHIAFKLTEQGSWNIKNISLAEAEVLGNPVSGFDGNDNTSQSVKSIDETFLSSIGSFSIYDITRYESKDEHIWICDSKYGMTSQASVDQSESWLISPYIDASEYIEDPTLIFSHTAKYFENFSNELKLMISEDYVAGKNPKSSDFHWNEITIPSLPSGTNFTFKKNTIQLTDYKGKKFYIAFVYTASPEAKPLWEIKLVSLFDNGKPTENEWNGDNKTANHVESITGINSDFSIFDVYRLNTESEIWKIDEKTQGQSASDKSESWLISPSFDLSTYRTPILSFKHNQSNFTDMNTYCSVLVSTDFNGENINSATWTPIELSKWPTSSTYIDATASLDDFKSLNVHIAFKYKANGNNGRWGIQLLSIYDKGIPSENQWNGDNNTAKEVTSISSITSSDFSIFDVKRFNEDSKIWTISSSNSTAKATNTENSESWLISPLIDASAYNDVAKIIVAQSGNDATSCFIKISKNYNGSNNPNSSDVVWEDITNNIGEEGIPTTYKKQKFHIAFIFKNSTENNPIWKITSLNVSDKGFVPTFNHKGTKDDPYDYEDFNLVELNSSVYVKGIILGTIISSKPDYGITENSSNTNLFIATSQSDAENNKFIPVELPSGKIRTGINLKDHPELINKEIIIYGTKKTYFNIDNSIKSTKFVIIDGNEYGTEPSK